MSSAPSHVAVFGPGLMGASLLMALRAKSPRTRLSAWARRAEAVQELEQRGLADAATTDAATAVRGADAVVLCVPVDRMEEVARLVAPHLGADALATDVGSTKQKLAPRLEEIFSGGKNFVGSHPMCGSEESGMDAARADLYEGALCVVCPTGATRADLPGRAAALWETVGARTAILSPDEHDAAAAAASHVPHIAAAALVELMARQPAEFRHLCASGFRDTTRIAAGSPVLWAGILGENAEKIAAALGELESILAGYRKAIVGGRHEEITRFLASAAEKRGEIFPKE